MDFKMFTCSYFAFLRSIKENLEERRNFDGVTFFLNWDSLHARLNSHLEAWRYKKKKRKKVKAYRKFTFRT